jgi:sigma-54 specific flagellar transcriptional regulator A
MDVTGAAGRAGAGPASPAERAPDGTVAHIYPDGLVCGPQSPLVDVRRTCLRVAASQATVLLTGETGTGKEVFARLIHAHSPRAKRPFVPVNCGAIPEALLESELFGYVKGAFTGAVHPRKGRVALAEGGTLFLDEIGELPLSLQVKLLRLLQARTYEPVGSSESVAADFRLVAATNRDLLAEVRAGRFRQDLYYRLNVCPIHLPPLRQRRGDVIALFEHFWRAHGERRPVEPGVFIRLERHDWPGNVRELENLVERVSVIAEGTVIRVQDLPPPLSEDLAESAELPGVSPSEMDLLTRPSVSLAPVPPVAPDPLPPPVVPVIPPPPPPLSVVPDADLPALARVGAQAASPPEPHRGRVWEPSQGSHHNDQTPPPEMPTPAALLLDGVQAQHDLARAGALGLPVNLPSLLRELEEAYIAKALAQTGGNKKEAARLLGMGRTTLVEKLRRRNSDTSAS